MYSPNRDVAYACLRLIYTTKTTQRFCLRLGHLVTKEFCPVNATNAKTSRFCRRVN